MKKKTNLIRDGGVYTATNLLNSLVPFFLLPGYTRVLTLGDYGVLAIFENFITFLAPILMFGVSGVLSVDYFRKKRIFVILFSSAFVVPCFLFLVLLISVCLIPVSSLFQGAVDRCDVMVLLAVGMFQVVTLLRLMLFQVQKKPMHYLMLQGWVILAGVGLTAHLVISSLQGWHGRLSALFIAYGIAAIYSLLSFYFGGYLKLTSVVFKKVKYVVRVGGPLVPHSLGMLLIIYFDRILLAKYWGAEEVGRYAFAHQLAMGVSLIQNSFTQAWGPYLFSAMSDSSKSSKIRVVAISFVAFLFICCLLLIFISNYLSEFVFGKEFELNIFILSMVAFGFFFTGVYKVFVGFVFYEKQTKYLTKIAVVVVLCNIGLNSALIPMFGADAAAVVMLLSMMLLAWLTYLISQRVSAFRWV